MNQFKAQFVQNGPNGLKCIALDWMVWMDWSGLKCYIDVAQKEYNKVPPSPSKKKKKSTTIINATFQFLYII